MKIKILVSLMLLCCCMGMCACSKGAGTEKNNKSVKNETENTGSDEPMEIAEFSGELDFDYVYETDCQSERGEYVKTVYTEDGKYYLENIGESNERLLHFYDNASGKDVIVCSKSNCEHSAEGCDAYFSEAEYPFQQLWYYQEALYTWMLREDYICIEKISLDGSVREESCVLTRLNVESEVQADGLEHSQIHYPEMQLHRGYVYYSTYYPGCTEVRLYRVKLESEEEAELLYSYQGNNPGLYRIKPYGRYVLFQMGSFSEDYINMDASIYAYDTEEENISRICQDAIREYTVIGNCLYYLDLKDNVYRKDLETGEITLFFETDISTDFYNCRLFGTEAGLVYEITDWNAGAKVQQILLDYDENGKEPEKFNGKEFQPYSF